ncbi:MAG TPA: HupE/UreJ family protein, partial [Gemmatimonadaceae bacterium]
MILRLNATRRPAVMLAALFAIGLTFLLARPLDAHDIPSRVAVLAFVKVDHGHLRIVLRAPLEAMRDMNWPEKELGYLDLPKASPMARDAAQLWIVDYLQVYENGALIPNVKVAATRISIPSEKTFGSYDAALAATTGEPVPASVDIPWKQALIDVVLDYPITSDSSSFAIKPLLARLGLETTTVLRYITRTGAERAYPYVGDPGLVQLDPRWYHAAWQFVKLGINHILSGIDHLLFVLCLVIPFRKLRPLIVIVTAFTVAHSIT